MVAFDVDAAFRLEHVTATASGSPGLNVGIYSVGVPNAPTLTHVTATGRGGGSAAGVILENDAASPRFTDLVATGTEAPFTYGVYLLNGRVTIHDSVLSGGTYSFYTAFGTARITDSVLSAPTYGIDGGHCADNVWPNFDPFDCS